MKLLKNIFLFILSILLFAVVFIIAILREVFVVFTPKKNDIKSMFYGFYIGLSFLFFSVALTIDKTAALMFPSFWNALFVKKYSICVHFGSFEAVENKYSISKILGLNYQKKSLTKFGRWFKEFLDLFEFEHVIKATE